MDNVHSLTSSTASADLVARFQSGDEASLERLWIRYLPRLKKWAHGRLARGHVADTDDLIQDAFVRSVNPLRRFKPEGPQSVAAYFRTIVLNQVRDHLRQRRRRPMCELGEVPERHTGEPSPVEQLLGQEAVETYQRALWSLPEETQQVVIAAVELGCSHAELAELFEKPSVDAARMAKGRALGLLARAMEKAGAAARRPAPTGPE